MNREPDFDASADMRLIELQRSALGLAPPQRVEWQSRLSSETALGLNEEPLPDGLSAVLAVEIAASPTHNVIPGAVVTLSLSLASDGALSARAVRAVVPLPGGTIYRPGSFVSDGRPGSDDQAAQLFGTGIEIAEIAPMSRRTFMWKVSVKLGTQPILVAPQVGASGCAVIGARPHVISRKAPSPSAFGAELSRIDAANFEAKPLIPIEIPIDELPIYELDPEEQLVHEAADAALSPMIESPPLPESPAAPSAVAPKVPPELQPHLAVMRYGRIDRPTLAFFQRVFNGSKSPTILQHCIFGGALACSTAADGVDARLKAHLDAQSQVLHRLVLHEKLGKKEPIVDYGGELLAELDAFIPADETHPALVDGVILLATELSEPTLAVLRRIFEERTRWDFVKARQFTLALQTQRAIGIGNERLAATLENALRAYAQTSMTTLQKLFVRLRLDRSTGILFQPEPVLDRAARAVLGTFETILS